VLGGISGQEETMATYDTYQKLHAGKLPGERIALIIRIKSLVNEYNREYRTADKTLEEIDNLLFAYYEK
jgi:hypothetical protein